MAFRGRAPPDGVYQSGRLAHPGKGPASTRYPVSVPSAATTRRLVYARYGPVEGEFVRHVLDGSVADQVVLRLPGTWFCPWSISADDRFLLFSRSVPETGGDLLLLDLAAAPGGGSAKLLVATPGSDVGAAISPNGEWFAYISDESGRNEIDLFWYLPDPSLASVDVFETVRSACDENGTPIFAFHESLVRGGAFVGVSADFNQLGRRAGQMAIAYLSSRDPSTLQTVPGDASRVVVNLAAARRLGLEPDANLVSLAAAVYR